MSEVLSHLCQSSISDTSPAPLLPSDRFALAASASGGHYFCGFGRGGQESGGGGRNFGRGGRGFGHDFGRGGRGQTFGDRGQGWVSLHFIAMGPIALLIIVGFFMVVCLRIRLLSLRMMGIY